MSERVSSCVRVGVCVPVVREGHCRERHNGQGLPLSLRLQDPVVVCVCVKESVSELMRV